MHYDSRRALDLLKRGTGQRDARFREGQEEAIQHLVEGRRRQLLVQKTGWGKMRNQIAAAERMGVRAETINSDNQDEWDRVEKAARAGEVDILLISPERLANERFREQVLAEVAERIALLVIDEAHCISDWGHDFRPHYRLSERTVRVLPPSLRLLATTATATLHTGHSREGCFASGTTQAGESWSVAASCGTGGSRTSWSARVRRCCASGVRTRRPRGSPPFRHCGIRISCPTSHAVWRPRWTCRSGACCRRRAPDPEQKTMENSDRQARNVVGSLAVAEDAILTGPVLLVDDVVDSPMDLHRRRVGVAPAGMRPGVAAGPRQRGRPVMNDAPSLNTRAILLLTAPLIIGRERRSSPRPLAAGEYNRLARRLRELQRQPADLLGSGARPLLEECRLDLDADRLAGLLDRGFLLSQAIERWRTRALWVTSRADAEYPRRLRKRLREQAPPVLYGCGNRTDLDTGGLAVVGSRNVDDNLIAYTEGVGRLAAEGAAHVGLGGRPRHRSGGDAGRAGRRRDGGVRAGRWSRTRRLAPRAPQRADGRPSGPDLPVRPRGLASSSDTPCSATSSSTRWPTRRWSSARSSRRVARGRRGRATRPPSIRLGLRPRHQRDGEGLPTISQATLFVFLLGPRWQVEAVPETRFG